MNKPIVLLDVDGVIADFASYYIKLAQCVTHRKLPEAHTIKHWRMSDSLNLSEREHTRLESLITQEGVAQSISPYYDAVLQVRGLMNIADVLFVTSPIEVSKTWVYDRQLWLINHFGIDSTRVVHTYYKEYVFGDILIDDKPSNIKKWLEFPHHKSGRLGLLWNHSFNTEANDPTAKGMARAWGWSDVRDAIEEWKEANDV